MQLDIDENLLVFGRVERQWEGPRCPWEAGRGEVGEISSNLLGWCAPCGARGSQDCTLPTCSCNQPRSLLVMMKVLTVADWLCVFMFHPLEKDALPYSLSCDFSALLTVVGVTSSPD